MRFPTLALPALALLAAAPLSAQTAPPTAPVATPDAERQASATRVAAKILPDGIYKQMFSSVFDQMGNGMMSQMMDIPMRDLAGLAGTDGEALKAKMGDGTLKQVMQILDPYFDERMKAMFKAMEPEFATLFTKFEPAMREGLAAAYAKRFDASQLKDLEAFFATPTGNAFASQSMTVFMDPAVMEKMMGVMPEVMKAMPAMMPKLTEAMAKFPKAKTAKELSPEDRKKLASLLGIPEGKLK